MNTIARTWPEDAAGRVPYWVYSDQTVYAAELERIWYGPHWLFCALEAEIPQIGDFKTATLGERPVIVIRSGSDDVSVAENRCAHRGARYKPRLRERIVVFNSEMFPNSLIYPA